MPFLVALQKLETPLPDGSGTFTVRSLAAAGGPTILTAGVATAVKALGAGVEVVGVEVEASCAFSAARAAGRIVNIAVGDTIADGLGGNVDPATITWPVIRDLVDRIVIVPERAVHEAIRTLLAEDHLVAEGAGVAAIAAAAGLAGIEGRSTAVLLTGANIDLPRLTSLLPAP